MMGSITFLDLHRFIFIALDAIFYIINMRVDIFVEVILFTISNGIMHDQVLATIFSHKYPDELLVGAWGPSCSVQF